ncbi:hypothetical protein [Allokutzneria sp. NRRL B-24872]|uniref:hypothetical protein n=1 Tax=Allokutzneria sp. NRRL B-24872 TaxID=1137961 RepID=UPI0011788A93|nr:hypothetical protein [Allokutzneria sp. NRRL B-24872]
MVRAAKALLVGAAITGLLAVTPLSASAAPTGKYFSSFDACEKEARVIRDGIVGAECKFVFWKWKWQLHVYG